MPTFNFTQSSLPFSLNPVIRPPSLADQDEARIRRAIELARLRELEASPGFQERQIRLQERGAVDTESYRTAEIGTQQRGQDVQVRGQDIEAGTSRRGQDILSETQRRAQDIGAPAEHARALSELYSAGGAISPEEIHAYAVKLGLVEPPKAAEKPQGEFGASGGPTATPAPATPVGSEEPGYGLGRAVAGAVKSLPISTANLGADIYNLGVLPPANLVGGLLGTPPLKRQKKITKYPSRRELIPEYLR